jgi:hypothetical protein
MKLVVDDDCGLISKALFKPGVAYRAEKFADGRIVLIALQNVELPTVKPRRIKGRLRGAKISLDRGMLAAAMRAERDSQ